MSSISKIGNMSHEMSRHFDSRIDVSVSGDAEPKDSHSFPPRGSIASLPIVPISLQMGKLYRTVLFEIPKLLLATICVVR